jgi:diguanylate cyclase (GGDEF)-like protein
MLRVADIFGRMGGEEFAVMLPETSSEGAYIAAEKLRRTIERASFQLDDQIISLTISIGVVTREVTDSSFENI